MAFEAQPVRIEYLLVSGLPAIYRRVVLTTCDHKDGRNLSLTETGDKDVIVGLQNDAEAPSANHVYQKAQSVL
ncbi:hypothetical protein H2248_002688 [Termitomyces sp. 'cryptogamus']|nr:hypothetical protein H2248_002688 [Termitomyces sp. 'cryptogamus']